MKCGAFLVAVFLVLAALLLVANTIRLAAFARRKEIGIMRLVGASTLYIALPFLLEALVTAMIGVGLAAGSLAAFMYFAVEQQFKNMLGFMPWVGWPEYLIAVLVVGDPRSAADPAADTRADPQIPQSVSRAGYLRGVTSPRCRRQTRCASSPVPLADAGQPRSRPVPWRPAR